MGLATLGRLYKCCSLSGTQPHLRTAMLARRQIQSAMLAQNNPKRTMRQPKLTIIRSSAHDLSAIPDGTVQCITTSPPYYGMRAYAGEQDVEWPSVTYRFNEWCEPVTVQGCEPGCSHEWGDPLPNPMKPYANQVPQTKWINVDAVADGQNNKSGRYCLHCSGWRGPLGQESSPVEYIGHLILCMREWRRVLRDDGTVWVNLGDGWANDGKWGGATGGKHVDELHGDSGIGRNRKSTGLKPKDKLMIPALFAQAARADGWWLRFDTTWIKRNGMPSSQTDRPTVASETIFLFSKSERYFYDQVAAGVPSTGQAVGSTGIRYRRDTDWFFDSLRAILDGDEALLNDDHGNPLAFVVNTAQYKEAHYAVWPERLVIPMLRASTSEHGACPQCGAPWQRVVEKPDMNQRPIRKSGTKMDTDAVHLSNNWQGVPKSAGQEYQEWRNANPDITTGWTPTCKCVAGLGDFNDNDHHVTLYVPEPVPCVVLDPFAGSGTTAAVSLGLGLDAIACDISQEYIEQHIMARAGDVARILAGEFKQLEGSHDDTADLPLFSENFCQ